MNTTKRWTFFFRTVGGGLRVLSWWIVGRGGSVGDGRREMVTNFTQFDRKLLLLLLFWQSKEGNNETSGRVCVSVWTQNPPQQLCCCSPHINKKREREWWWWGRITSGEGWGENNELRERKRERDKRPFFLRGWWVFSSNWRRGDRKKLITFHNFHVEGFLVEKQQQMGMQSSIHPLTQE